MTTSWRFFQKGGQRKLCVAATPLRPHVFHNNSRDWNQTAVRGIVTNFTERTKQTWQWWCFHHLFKTSWIFIFALVLIKMLSLTDIVDIAHFLHFWATPRAFWPVLMYKMLYIIIYIFIHMWNIIYSTISITVTWTKDTDICSVIICGTRKLAWVSISFNKALLRCEIKCNSSWQVRHTFLVGLVSYSDGIVAQWDGLRVQSICPHAWKLGSGDQTAFIRVHVHASSIHQ